MNIEISTIGDFIKIEKMADMIKVLGHPYRFTIFKYLCDCGCKKMRVKEIYSLLGMQQAIASRHLNELKKHGLLNRTTSEGKVYYQPNIENKFVGCISHCIMEIK